jgi:hypothetical protein
MAVAVQERVDLAEPAERVRQAEEFAVVVGLGIGEPRKGVLQQLVYSRRHLAREAELILACGLH